MDTAGILMQTNRSQDGMAVSSTFTPFPRLPSELRWYIWELSFEPRRLVMWYEGRQPAYDLDPRILVNHEASGVFFENYSRYFQCNGKKGYLLNFNLDTICFLSMGAFLDTMREYEEDMACVKKVDIRSLEVASHGSTAEQIAGPQTSLSGMFSLELVTIRNNSGLGPEEDQAFRWYSIEKRLLASFQSIREALLRQYDPRRPYYGPRVALIFPNVGRWKDEIYLETCIDPNHFSYGKIAWDVAGSLAVNDLGNFRVPSWIEQNTLLETPEGLLQSRIRNSRTLRNRIELRAYWDNHFLSIQPLDKLEMNLITSEYESILTGKELDLMHEINHLWWEIRGKRIFPNDLYPQEILGWGYQGHRVAFSLEQLKWDVLLNIILAARGMPWPDAETSVKGLQIWLERLQIYLAEHESRSTELS